MPLYTIVAYGIRSLGFYFIVPKSSSNRLASDCGTQLVSSSFSSLSTRILDVQLVWEPFCKPFDRAASCASNRHEQTSDNRYSAVVFLGTALHWVDMHVLTLTENDYASTLSCALRRFQSIHNSLLYAFTTYCKSCFSEDQVPHFSLDCAGGTIDGEVRISKLEGSAKR